jgi:hypothetical protein
MIGGGFWGVIAHIKLLTVAFMMSENQTEDIFYGYGIRPVQIIGILGEALRLECVLVGFGG